MKQPLSRLPALDTRTMVTASLGATLVQVPASSIAARFAGLPPFGGGASPVEFMLIYLILPGLASVVWIWFFAVWREPGGWHRLGLGRPAGGWLRPALYTGAGALVVSIVVAQLLRPYLGDPKGFPIELLPSDPGAGLVYGTLFIVGVAGTAPLIEEIVYRGVLYGWLRRRLPWFFSALFAATLHAAIHFDPVAIPALAAVFMLFAILYEQTGTLWAPVTAHALYNLLNIIAYAILPKLH